jgi:LuxR family maltose regulon positive regulatory protein
MSSLDQTLALPLDQGASAAPDWSVVPYPAIGDSATEPYQGSWAVRRAIVRARSALVAMRLDEAAKATNQLSRLLNHHEKSWCGRYASAHRILEALLQAAADQLAPAHCALMTLPALTSDPIATSLFRYLDWMRGGSDAGCMPDTVDYLAAPVGGKAIARIFNLCVSAALAFDRLHLTVSSSLASQALELARERYGNHCAISAFPATLLAQVAYEQGRFEEAEALLRPRIGLIRASGTLECVARASVILARLSLHRGQRRAALAILRDAEVLGHTRRWPRLISIAATEYSRAVAGCCVATHSLRAAMQLALSARVRRSLSCPETSRSDEPQSVAAIQTTLRSACSAVSDGRFDESYELLIRCLRVGAARGLRMIFADAGCAGVALLEGLYEVLPTTEGGLAQLRPYVATLLRFTAPVSDNVVEPPTYRPLSRRETGILQMIAGGMSNKRIAQSLGITPETVKSHAKSIFVKLEARTRAQAVARAESIGLL